MIRSLLLTTIAASLLGGVTAKADSFAVLFEAPGVQQTTIPFFDFASVGGVIVLGTETFNAPAFSSGGSSTAGAIQNVNVSAGFRSSTVGTTGSGTITTNFGFGTGASAPGVTGVYSGGVVISRRTEFGGASSPPVAGNSSTMQANSRFIQAAGSTSGNCTSAAACGNRPSNFPNSYTLTLTPRGGVPGVNYFGLWISALDSANQLQFFRNNTLIFTFTPSDLISALGTCPMHNGTTNPFCGNPTPPFLNVNRGELYAFVNFVDLSRTPQGTPDFFNRVVFTQTAAHSSARYESDNHTVGFCPDVAKCEAEGGTPLPVPEPSALEGLLVGMGVLGFAGMTSRKLKLGT